MVNSYDTTIGIPRYDTVVIAIFVGIRQCLGIVEDLDGVPVSVHGSKNPDNSLGVFGMKHVYFKEPTGRGFIAFTSVVHDTPFLQQSLGMFESR
jgi:hypothetical protein